MNETRPEIELPQIERIHFRRHGFADWVEFGLDNLHVEFHHLSGHIDIELITKKHVVVRNAWDEIKREYDQAISTSAYVGRTEHRGENPLDATDEIEMLILEHTGRRVHIDRNFVEAYTITDRASQYAYTANDVPIYGGTDVRGVTVAEMLGRGHLDWKTYPQGYKLERIANLLDLQEMLRMPFVDFYTLVHDNCYKIDFRERVMAAITTYEEIVKKGA